MANDPLVWKLLSKGSGKPLAKAIGAIWQAHLAEKHRIPEKGGALLVGNHTFSGLDAVILGALCLEHLGRVPRFLADRHLVSIPLVGKLLYQLGAIAGERADAVELLEDGNLVVVYPGGVDDAFKLSSEAYQLKWGKRAGFAWVALKAKVPVVPVVGEGIDELFEVPAKEPWLGRRLFGSERYDFPLVLGAYGLPIPKRVPIVFHALEPVEANGDPESEEDVQRVRQETMERMEAVLRVIRTLRGRAG